MFDRIKQIAETAEQAATDRGLKIVITVVDVHGNTLLVHRMFDAPVFALEISRRKAYTSATFGVATATLTAQVQPGGPLYGLTGVSGGELIAFPGGVAVQLNDEIRVGVGVSGGTSEQDAEIVELATADRSDSRS